jgi:hypothetical protein
MLQPSTPGKHCFDEAESRMSGFPFRSHVRAPGQAHTGHQSDPGWLDLQSVDRAVFFFDLNPFLSVRVNSG